MIGYYVGVGMGSGREERSYKVSPVLSGVKVGLVMGQELGDGRCFRQGQDSCSRTSDTCLHAAESFGLQQLFDDRDCLWGNIYFDRAGEKNGYRKVGEKDILLCEIKRDRLAIGVP